MVTAAARTLAGLVAVAVPLLAPAAPAAADPPGPTDYQTDIVAVEPDTPAITVESIGGDSFVRLIVEPGHEVDVIGYQGEPYLRFGADGVVEQNENSPSRWLNDERYGDVDPPATATADAEPDWVVVADDGSFSWHDHRTHWMNEQKPPGADAGDVVLEAVVPLVVDGAEVDVAVRSRLLAGPSPVGPVVGAVLGLASIVVGRRLARLAGVSLAVGAWAALGAFVGASAFMAVPGETEPSRLWWLLPAIAVAVVALALVLRARGIAWEIWSVLVAAAGVELLLWSWQRRLSISRAFIPTDAPFWLDRLVVAGAAAAGLAAVAVVVMEMAQPAPAQDAPAVT